MFGSFVSGWSCWFPIDPMVKIWNQIKKLRPIRTVGLLCRLKMNQKATARSVAAKAQIIGFQGQEIRPLTWTSRFFFFIGLNRLSSVNTSRYALNSELDRYAYRKHTPFFSQTLIVELKPNNSVKQSAHRKSTVHLFPNRLCWLWNGLLAERWWQIFQPARYNRQREML